MSDPGIPAERVLRTKRERTSIREPQLKSGRKYRLVFRRKGVEEDPTSRRQAESLQRAAVDGKPFCEECEKRQPSQVRLDLSAKTGNAVAQAQTLQLAAKNGAPFCEECAQATAQRAPQAPPAPPPLIDPETAAAQAATLAGAAQRGSPFCEECAQARRPVVSAS